MLGKEHTLPHPTRKREKKVIARAVIVATRATGLLQIVKQDLLQTTEH
jgi:hypothetical protein